MRRFWRWIKGDWDKNRGRKIILEYGWLPYDMRARFEDEDEDEDE